MGHTIVVPTEYGPLIVNRHDFNQAEHLVKSGQAVDHREICLLGEILARRGRGVFVDAGGCFGTYAIPLARVASTVHVFEAQPVLCNMIAGSAALNSLVNVRCHHAVLSDTGELLLEVPQYDYNQPLNFGSIEFGGPQREKLHQERGEDLSRLEFVKSYRLDDFALTNVSAIKIDVEGMEAQVVRGAAATIERERPVMYIETFKCSGREVEAAIPKVDYSFWQQGDNLWAVPREFNQAFVDLCPQFGIEVKV